MKKNLIIFGCVLAVLVFNACEQKEDPWPLPSKKSYDIYVAGEKHYYDEGHGDYKPSVAVVWKNGVATSLSDGTKPSAAGSIFVSEGDVYVAGYEQSTAILWKNGVATRLTDETTWSFANSVYVSDGDVYVVGSAAAEGERNSQAILWKNGVATPLTDGTTSATATSVFVSGNDIYIVGRKWDSSDRMYSAVLWKNGKMTTLSDGTKNAGANDVTVSKGQVYVAGYEYATPNRTVAVLWVDGVAKVLSDGTEFSNGGASAYSVAVTEDDVYVSGYQRWQYGPNIYFRDFATLWSNEGVVLLSSENEWGFATSVFSHGKDLFLAGRHLEAGYVPDMSNACIWAINGNCQFLQVSPEPFSRASDIFAVPKE